MAQVQWTDGDGQLRCGSCNHPIDDGTGRGHDECLARMEARALRLAAERLLVTWPERRPGTLAEEQRALYIQGRTWPLEMEATDPPEGWSLGWTHDLNGTDCFIEALIYRRDGRRLCAVELERRNQRLTYLSLVELEQFRPVGQGHRSPLAALRRVCAELMVEPPPLGEALRSVAA